MSLLITGTFWEKPPLFCQVCKIEVFLPHFLYVTFKLLEGLKLQRTAMRGVSPQQGKVAVVVLKVREQEG